MELIFKAILFFVSLSVVFLVLGLAIHIYGYLVNGDKLNTWEDK